MNLKAHAVLVIATLAAAGTQAQTLDYGAFEQLFGEPVTASATGTPQRESEVPASMQIITADEIRRSGARDLAGVLRHVSGVDVLHTSNDHTDLAIRGYNQAFSPRLLVLVDGRQVYADYYGFTPWSTVPVELAAIRQIEIVKGPNSALFGFNAVGGVINIVTYDPLNDDAGGVTVIAGTQAHVQASAVSTWKFGDRAGLRLSAGQRNNDDFSTPLSLGEVGTRRGNERFAVNADAGVRLGDDLRLGLELTHSDSDQAEFSPLQSMSYGRYDTQSLKADVAADTSIGLIQAAIYRNETNADVFVGTDPSAFTNFANRVTVAQVESVTKVAPKHTVRASLELRDNSLDTTPISGARVFYDVAAISGMWEWTLRPTLVVTTASRIDRWSLGRDGFVPPGYGLTNADWDRSQTTPSFNVGAVWQASDGDRFRFLVGRGVQVPNLLWLGGLLIPIPPFGYFSGVPDLEPTVVKNYEIGWRRMLAGGVELDVNAFHGQSREMLAGGGGVRFNPDFTFIASPTNVGRSHTKGLELAVDGSFDDHWTWGASYIAQDIEDQFSLPLELTITDYEHTTPERVLRAELGWARGPWEVDGYLRQQSSSNGIVSLTPEFGPYVLAPISSYTTIDARVGYRLNDRMTLALSGQNLNRSEQRQTVAPAVERQIFATFSMTL